VPATRSPLLFPLVPEPQLGNRRFAVGDHLNFGYSVAVSGDTAIVGVYKDDDSGLDSGSAYLFDVTSGLQLAKLTAADGALNDWFGFSVGVSGNRAIVGAYGDDDNGSYSGSAYLFEGPNPVPEPSTLLMWSLLSALGVAWWWRRKFACRSN